MSDFNQLSKIIPDFEYPEQGDLRFNSNGLSPKILLYPKTVEEISEALKFCNKTKTPVIPSGNSTKLFLGNSVSNVEVVISLKNMDKVLEHETADLVSTVECGLPLKKFQRSLNRKGQMLPVNCPFEDSASVGGIISTNLTGSFSTRYGGCRELLLGIKAVRADGEIIKSGAKVVKNVAGYDIPKLMVGAFGTLSILTEATFRLYPKPEFSETAILVLSESQSIKELFERISGIDVIPSSFDILDKNLSARFLPKIKDSYCVIYRIESFEDAVIKQMKDLESVTSKKVNDFFRIKDRSEKNLWKKINEFPFDNRCELTCRANLPIDSTFKLVEILQEINKSMKVKIEFILRPQRGITIFSINGSSADIVYAANLIRSQVKALKGAVVFTSVSDELKEKIDVFGDFGSSHAIMKNLKKHFDQNNILSPGRIF